jgi:ankyrin repeat protein
VRLLLQRGAAVNAADPSTGVTAYHAACAANQPQCAEVLVLAGCVVGLEDASGRTGRQIAEDFGHTAVRLSTSLENRTGDMLVNTISP